VGQSQIYSAEMAAPTYINLTNKDENAFKGLNDKIASGYDGSNEN
jgi:hypothetical protein